MRTSDDIIAYFHTLTNETNRLGMARFGIETQRAFGISVKTLRAYAKTVKNEYKTEPNYKALLHELASALWESAWHEARLCAILLEDPQLMTIEQLETWVRSLNSWDLCDQLCSNLLWTMPNADALIYTLCADEATFVRRAGFALIAVSAVHDKEAPDARFLDYLPIIEQYAFDERNFVKKAVNWSLRQIGKRNPALRLEAIACAERIRKQQSSSARWIAADALRELQGYIFRERKNTHHRKHKHIYELSKTP